MSEGLPHGLLGSQPDPTRNLRLVDRLTSPAPTAYRDEQDRHLLTPHALTDDDLAELALAELRQTTRSQPAVAVDLLQMIGLVVDAATASGNGDHVTHSSCKPV